MTTRSVGESWFNDTLRIEHRPERPYDDEDASHLIMPNGSFVASYDRAFLGVALREVFAFWVEAVDTRSAQ